MCQINQQQADFSHDLENPLLSDLNSSEWFEDESQFCAQKVNYFFCWFWYPKKTIDIRNLRKEYGNFTALEDITLSVYEGEIFW